MNAETRDGSEQVIAPRRYLIASGVIRRTPANAAAAHRMRIAHLLNACRKDYTAAAAHRRAQNRDDAGLCAPERERGAL